jgi:hypothetical protein
VRRLYKYGENEKNQIGCMIFATLSLVLHPCGSDLYLLSSRGSEPVEYSLVLPKSRG